MKRSPKKRGLSKPAPSRKSAAAVRGKTVAVTERAGGETRAKTKIRLDIALVDRLYGVRLYIVLGNDAIFEHVKSTGSEWQDFIDICYAVADQRMKGRVGQRDKAFRDRVYQLSKDTRSAEHPFRIVSDSE